MNRILLTAFLLSACFSLLAQVDFRSAYIVLQNNDTIHGMADFKGDIQNSLECRFRDDHGKISFYKPGEIKCYRYSHGKYYISRYIMTGDTTTRLFVEYLVEGRKNLYYYRDAAGNHYLFDIAEDTLKAIPYYEKTLNENGQNYFYESKTHLGYLKAYFRDCPALFKDIDKIETPGMNNLIALTKKYHHIQCNDSSCIVYYKPPPRVKIAFEPMLGSFRIRTEEIAAKEYLSEFGMLVYVWLPRSNENLYFKTGAIIPAVRDHSLVRVPLQLEYRFPGIVFQPKFDFGMDIYEFDKSLVWFPCITAGGLFKLSPNISIEANFETDVMTLTFNPAFFIAHAFQAGVCVTL